MRLSTSTPPKKHGVLLITTVCFCLHHCLLLLLFSLCVLHCFVLFWFIYQPIDNDPMKCVFGGARVCLYVCVDFVNTQFCRKFRALLFPLSTASLNGTFIFFSTLPPLPPSLPVQFVSFICISFQYWGYFLLFFLCFNLRLSSIKNIFNFNV